MQLRRKKIIFWLKTDNYEKYYSTQRTMIFFSFQLEWIETPHNTFLLEFRLKKTVPILLACPSFLILLLISSSQMYMSRSFFFFPFFFSFWKEFAPLGSAWFYQQWYFFMILLHTTVISTPIKVKNKCFNC